MNENNWKRVLVLFVALICATIYVESHVRNDYQMIRQIRKQEEEQIIMMKSYIRILESGKSGKWKRCI